MPYLEELLQKKLHFQFKQNGLKFEVHESFVREDVNINVGCVFVGTAANCRTYVQGREAKQALRSEEKRLTAPVIAEYDHRQARNLFARCLAATERV